MSLLEIFEGDVSNAVSSAINTLNSLAVSYLKQAEQFKFDNVVIHRISDISDLSRSVRVDVQLANQQNSAVVGIEIYDVDNVKVLVPKHVADQFGVNQYNAFTSDQASTAVEKSQKFLGFIYEHALEK